MSNNNPETKTVSEEEIHNNPFLAMEVEPNSDLKKYLVEYVGTKLDQEQVTVDMIANVLASEFPEFMMVLAEENFIRGYETGLEDVYKTLARETEQNTEE
jgi:outer membrane lipoprotein-sorting protein|tara:strand:+ start:206 stop:505 length:300 start_codon:yes stop_codon:yes gene_type:complete